MGNLFIIAGLGIFYYKKIVKMEIWKRECESSDPHILLAVNQDVNTMKYFLENLYINT